MMEFLSNLWQLIITPVGTTVAFVILATIDLVIIIVSNEMIFDAARQITVVCCLGFLIALSMVCGSAVIELLCTQRWLGTILLFGAVVALLSIGYNNHIVAPFYLGFLLTDFGIYKMYHAPTGNNLFWTFFWGITAVWAIICAATTLDAFCEFGNSPWSIF